MIEWVAFRVRVDAQAAQVHILSHLTWSTVASVDLPTRVTASSRVNVWCEQPEWLEKTLRRGFIACKAPHLSHTLLIKSTR